MERGGYRGAREDQGEKIEFIFESEVKIKLFESLQNIDPVWMSCPLIMRRNMITCRRNCPLIMRRNRITCRRSWHNKVWLIVGCLLWFLFVVDDDDQKQDNKDDKDSTRGRYSPNQPCAIWE